MGGSEDDIGAFEDDSGVRRRSAIDTYEEEGPRKGAPFAFINPGLVFFAVFRHTALAAYSKLLPR
jgi:hypothetical protein